MPESTEIENVELEGVTIPEGAKKPQDHKAKGDDEVPETLTATVDGVEVSVPGESLNDYRILRAMRRLQRNEDVSQLVDVADMLLGEEQADRVMRHLEDSAGRIDVEKGVEFIGEVLGALHPNS